MKVDADHLSRLQHPRPERTDQGEEADQLCQMEHMVSVRPVAAVRVQDLLIGDPDPLRQLGPLDQQGLDHLPSGGILDLKQAGQHILHTEEVIGGSADVVRHERARPVLRHRQLHGTCEHNDTPAKHNEPNYQTWALCVLRTLTTWALCVLRTLTKL